MRRLMLHVIILLFAVLPCLSYADDMTSRFELLTKEIRCVVCQNQSIADSAAPLAEDLRTKVRQMMVAGKSDEDIKNYLVQRYGEFILFRPRWHKSTLLLWLFPILGLAIFAAILRRTIHAMNSHVISEK